MTFTHDPTSPFPVLRHRTWKHLLRALEGGKYREWIRAGQERFAGNTTINHLMLASVVPLAYVLATACPELCRKPTLRVVVMAVDEIAGPDGGRWYRMLGELLGEAVTLEVTFLSPPDLDMEGVSGEYEATLQRILRAVPPIPTRVVDPEGYLLEAQAPDVLYLPFHPLADDFAAWVSPAALPEYLAQGTTIVGVNQLSWAERDVTLALFEAYGVGQGEAVDTPYGLAEMMLDPEDRSMGRYGWILRPAATGEADIAWGRVAQLKRFWRSFAEDTPERNDNNPHAGQWLRLGADPQGVLTGTGGRGINLKTHQVYSVEYGSDGGHLLEHLGDPPNHFESPMPDPGMPRLDRAMYADHAMGQALFPSGFKEVLKGSQALLREGGPLRDTLREALGEAGDRDAASVDGLLNSFADSMGGESGVDAGLPVFVAVENNDAVGILAAVAAGHDPNERDGQSWTPLCTAAEDGALEAVNALVKSGARLNDATIFGWRPIDLALNRGHSAVAIALLDAGAELENEPDGIGMKALEVLRSPMAPASVLAWLAARGRSV